MTYEQMTSTNRKSNNEMFGKKVAIKSEDQVRKFVLSKLEELRTIMNPSCMFTG